jgi:predicted aspartyl protease
MSKKIINPLPENWANNNRQLLRQYVGEWVAHDTQNVIAHHKDYAELLRLARMVAPNFVIYSAHHEGKVRFLPIRFRNFQTHEWQPLYPVTIRVGTEMFTDDMLVDSGADFCLIPFHIGLQLGLSLSVGEPVLQADGIGGSVSYAIKNMLLEIDGISIQTPVAWVQDKNCYDLIIGREVIFDHFDIEFKQADEVIIFKPRNATPS